MQPPPYALVGIFVTLMGLAIGSFLNVVIYRLPRDLSVSFPPSNCTSCHAPIRWYHNIPLLGYALIGGRCAACRAPVSIRYPIVEALTGALFLWHFLVIGPEWILAVRLAFAAAMVALFAIDLEHQILPDEITLGGIAVGFAASFAVAPGWMSSLIGIVAGGAIPWAIAELYLRVRGVDGLGFGDVKMLAMIGAVLGWELMLLTLLLASASGAVVGVGLMLAGRGTRQLKLPFGTFLAVAAIVAGLHGAPLVEWYAGFYR
ncbi:MAG: prepilin peptidase [Acidobacteria bacterium]|nr:prepilin peptidase [Acidobacteriota bacterium]